MLGDLLYICRYSVQEDDAPTAPKPVRERPKSMPPISAPLTPGLKWTSTMSSAADTLSSKRGWTEKLNGLQHATFGGRSGRSTPVQTPSSGTDRDEWIDEKWLRDQEHRKEKRRKRKKAEVYVSFLRCSDSFFGY